MENVHSARNTCSFLWKACVFSCGARLVLELWRDKIHKPRQVKFGGLSCEYRGYSGLVLSKAGLARTGPQFEEAKGGESSIRKTESIRVTGWVHFTALGMVANNFACCGPLQK